MQPLADVRASVAFRSKFLLALGVCVWYIVWQCIYHGCKLYGSHEPLPVQLLSGEPPGAGGAPPGPAAAPEAMSSGQLRKAKLGEESGAAGGPVGPSSTTTFTVTYDSEGTDDGNWPDDYDSDDYEPDPDLHDEPNSTELALWWTQPLTLEELDHDHFEFAFVPFNITDLKRSNGTVDPRYTRAWRRDSLLRLLRAWHGVCLRLNLSYWLDAGTLLGRKRSNGSHIIPWDIDADVGMLRGEFAKLNASVNRIGQGLLRDEELGLPPGVLLTTQQVRSKTNLATARGKVIPGRVVDTWTGFYVDVFGDYFLRDDGDIQMFWPFQATAKCVTSKPEDGSAPWVGKECQGPCDHEWCYTFETGLVLPPVQCHLKGAGEWLYCPHDEDGYLRAQYYDCCSPDHQWDSRQQQFVSFRR